MPRKKRWEKDKEPFIACIDDLEGGFEIVEWFSTEEEAIKTYDTFEGEYPDEDGRHKHLFKMIHTSGHDLDQTSGDKTT